MNIAYYIYILSVHRLNNNFKEMIGMVLYSSSENLQLCFCSSRRVFRVLRTQSMYKVSIQVL